MLSYQSVSNFFFIYNITFLFESVWRDSPALCAGYEPPYCQLFLNGALLLGQLGPKMACEVELLPREHFSHKCQKGHYQNPFARGDQTAAGPCLNWKILRMTVTGDFFRISFKFSVFQYLKPRQQVCVLLIRFFEEKAQFRFQSGRRHLSTVPSLSHQRIKSAEGRYTEAASLTLIGCGATSDACGVGLPVTSLSIRWCSIRADDLAEDLRWVERILCGWSAVCYCHKSYCVID